MEFRAENNMSKVNLSQSQLGIYYAHLYENEGKFFNIFSEIKFQNEISTSIFEKMIHKLSFKHPILRSVLRDDEQVPYRQVLDQSSPIFELIDYSTLSEENAIERYDNLIKEWKNYQFPLVNHLLFKSVLVKLPNSEYRWLACFHQIINDGFGVSYICEEAGKLYSLLLNNEELSVEVNSNYENYIEYEQAYLNSTKHLKAKEFWENKLKEFDIIDPKQGFANYCTNLKSNRYTKTIDIKSSTEIKNFLFKKNISGNTFFLSVLYSYLSKLFVREQIAIGTTVLNRPKPKYKMSGGMFVNFIPNVFSIDTDQSITELFSHIEKEIKESFRHQRFPMSEVYRELSLKREDIYPVLFNYQKSIFIEKFGDLDVSHDWLFNGYEEHFFSLNVVDREDSGCFELSFDINQSAFSEAESHFLIDRYLYLVNQFISNSSQKISELNIIPNKEYTRIRENLTGKKKEYSNIDISNIVDYTAQLLPNKIAINDINLSITYSELLEKINRIVSYLENHGIKRNQTVCVISNPSINSIATMIALFKIRAVYVPVDPSTPTERIKFIQQDCNAALSISDEMIDHITTVVFSDIDSENIVVDRKNSCDSDDLAYIIYTSGSTGKPKGVKVQFKQIAHYVSQCIEYFNITNEDKVAQQASLSFDTSLEEILPALVSGATLEILNRSNLSDIEYVNDELITRKITLLSTSPTLIAELNNIKFLSPYLRILISGGDALHSHQINNIDNNYAIYNTYGPTETTICATYSKVNSTTQIDLGKPIANTEVALLNDKNEDVPFSCNW